MNTCEYVHEGRVCGAEAEYYPAVKKWFCKVCIEDVRLEMAAEYGHVDCPEANAHPFSERQLQIAREKGFIVTDDFRVQWSKEQVEDIKRRAKEMYEQFKEWEETPPAGPMQGNKT